MQIREWVYREQSDKVEDERSKGEVVIEDSWA